MALTFRWRAFVAALRDAWPVWVTITGVVLAFAAGCRLSVNESTGVRYSGTILQVFGLGTVAVGLSRVRRSFGRPSLREKAWAWLRRLGAVFRQPEPINLKATLTAGATASADLRAVAIAGPGASLDRRVSILEENLSRLRDEVEAKAKKITAELKALEDTVSHQIRDSKVEADRLQKQLEEFAVGGLHLEFIGLTWLVLGILGTSVPDEIAKLLSFVASGAWFQVGIVPGLTIGAP